MSFEEFITQKMKLDEELYKLEEKIAALRAHAEKSTTSLSLAPGGNAFDDSRLEDLVIKISDLEEKEKKIRKEMEGVSAQLSSFLVELDSTDQMKILMMPGPRSLRALTKPLDWECLSNQSRRGSFRTTCSSRTISTSGME